MKAAEKITDPASREKPAEQSGFPLKDYVAIARPDHWTKNFFMLPGLFLGMLYSHKPLSSVFWPVCIGMAATCLISSANYTINEWLDRHFDRFHPKKRSRPSVSGRITAVGVYVEYALLCGNRRESVYKDGSQRGAFPVPETRPLIHVAVRWGQRSSTGLSPRCLT